MQLVECLSGGVNGAGNGFARLYAYGTSTRVAYYADFNGTVHASSGADLTLDSNGGSVVYVNQLTDIYVYDSAGNLVRSFTEGESAPATEVISASFTGTNRTTGVSGTSLPTTLQSVMDLWTATNGAPDWKVLFGGVATSIQGAVAGVAGLFFNAKDPTYGAVGDGVTDDTTAIQNCMNAAGAVKGIVFFPAGTYRHTSALSVPRGVSLWGVGSAGSVLSLDHASNSQLTYNYSIAGTQGWQEIRNLSIQAQQSNSGSVVTIPGSSGAFLAIYNSTIGSTSTLNTGTSVNVANNTSEVLLNGCLVTANGAANSAVSADQSNVKIRAIGTRFLIGVGTYNGTGFLARNAFIQGCTFDMSGISAGTCAAVNLDGTAGYGPKGAIVGSEFIAPTGGSNSAIQTSNSNDATTAVSESGNIFRGSWTAVFSGFTAQSNIPSIQAVTRESLGFNVTSNAASLDVKADQYGYTSLTRTNTTAQTVTSNLGHGGATWTLVVYNNGGGANTITFGSGFFQPSSPFTTGSIANGKMAIYQFRMAYLNGAATWFPIAAPVVTT